MTVPLPDKRTEVIARDLDGNGVVLVDVIASKLYVCPSCREPIELGTRHVLVHFTTEEGESYHQHWHTRCVKDDLAPGLRDVSTRPTEKGPSRGRRRAEALERRRRR